MIRETLVISDTNILLDLLSVGLTEAFFELPCEKWTSDFVFREIKTANDMKTIYRKKKTERLVVKEFSFEELIKIQDLRNQSGCNSLSITDCSVWYLAKLTNGRLLTGDKKLRDLSEANGVKVSGILFVLDNIVEYGILSPQAVADKLSLLMKNNLRLPTEECEKRLKQWTE